MRRQIRFLVCALLLTLTVFPLVARAAKNRIFDIRIETARTPRVDKRFLCPSRGGTGVDQVGRSLERRG